MKLVVRRQSGLLFRKSYKATRLTFRPVAQKQSARLITGKPRSVTARDDQFPW